MNYPEMHKSRRNGFLIKKIQKYEINLYAPNMKNYVETVQMY